MTAFAYAIGAAYSLRFDGRGGLDNLDLLGFGVQATFSTRRPPSP
jgi:hypothetical protein